VDEVHLADGSQAQGLISPDSRRGSGSGRPLEYAGIRHENFPGQFYRGELYDIGFSRPETHVGNSPGAYTRSTRSKMAGCVEFAVAYEGHLSGARRLNDRDMGQVSSAGHFEGGEFEHFLLIRGDDGGMGRIEERRVASAERLRRTCAGHGRRFSKRFDTSVGPYG